MTKPTTFNAKKHCKDIIDVLTEGKHVASFCALNGIGRSTYYDWIDTYPEFAKAVEIGKERAEEWWFELGKNGVGAEKFNAGVYQFLMTNKFNYRRDRVVKVEGFQNAPTPNAQMNLIAKEIANGSITGGEASALANVVAATAAVNEKTALADQVKELMELVNK